MVKNIVSLFCFLMIAASGAAQAQENSSGLESITIEGGPIASKHFQASDEDFHERHTLAILKIATKEHGNWGLYFLNPNSVNDTSVGAGYITDPYTIPIGPTKLELTAALGLVTGYQDYPVPLIAGQARLEIYESGPWNAGLAMAAMPYFMKDEVNDDNEFGIVATTPFLSLRYRFD